MLALSLASIVAMVLTLLWFFRRLLRIEVERWGTARAFGPVFFQRLLLGRRHEPPDSESPAP